MNPDAEFSESTSDSDSSSDSGEDEETKNKREIGKIIKQANKDVDNKHERDLAKMKNNMAQDKYMKKDMLKNLGIPEFDKNEHISSDDITSDEEV